MLVEAENQESKNQESRIELPYYSNTGYSSIITFVILFLIFLFTYQRFSLKMIDNVLK